MPVSELDESEPLKRWSIPLRIFFRFICCYWVLYLFPSPIRRTVSPWVATQVFHITGPAATFVITGSGDTTLGYIEALVCLTIALVACVVWSLLDWRRGNYRTVHVWLRLLVRYMLASVMMGYGVSKVFPLQFPPNRLERMMQPFGDFSPMGVLWSFMSTSTAYTSFTGFTEVACALLLMFRRTASLGAMLSIAVMTNVVALNFCYDVPVKLSSTHLLMMSVFLLAPDLRRLTNALVLNRATAPVDLSGPAFERRWLRIGSHVIWIAYVTLVVGHGFWNGYRAYTASQVRSPIYGLYRVDSGAPSGWKKVAVEASDSLTVRFNNDSSRYFPVDYNLSRSTIELNKKANLASFIWSRSGPLDVVLTGTFDGAPHTIHLHRIDDEIPLLKRGFHWISEVPFNR